MLAQVLRIGFLMGFPSRSALEARNELRWPSGYQSDIIPQWLTVLFAEKL